MKFNLFRWSLAAFLVLAFSIPVQAQVGAIRGEVKDAEGNPIPDVQIRIQGLDVKREYKVKTDKKGKYLHAGVSLQGNYRIVAEKEGYVSSYEEGVRAGFGMDDPRGEHNFTMNEGKSAALEFDLTEEEREKLRQQREEANKRKEAAEEVRQFFNQGLEAYNLGNFEQAVQSFQAAVEKDESQPAVWGNLGNALAKLKKNQEAINAYQKAADLDPDESVYFQNMGSVYSEMGDVDKAKEMYEKAATVAAGGDPKAAAINYFNMGVTFINAGKNKDAVDALTKAIEADPGYSEAHYQLGITKLGMNQIDEAVQHLAKYVELAPTGPNAEVAKQLVQELKK